MKKTIRREGAVVRTVNFRGTKNQLNADTLFAIFTNEIIDI